MFRPEASHTKKGARVCARNPLGVGAADRIRTGDVQLEKPRQPQSRVSRALPSLRLVGITLWCLLRSPGFYRSCGRIQGRKRAEAWTAHDPVLAAPSRAKPIAGFVDGRPVAVASVRLDTSCEAPLDTSEKPSAFGIRKALGCPIHVKLPSSLRAAQ